ncbi:MAG: HobA family DNA replication regulator [Wolinella sp.]
MQDLLKWTIETIRNDESMMSWLEERKFEWVPLAANAIRHILDGYSVIVMTDSERNWFGSYIAASVNKPQKNRPYMPVYNIKSIYPNIECIKNSEDYALIHDMLSISFKEQYLFWYIGKSDDSRAKLAFGKDESFCWLLDDEMHNSFMLRSSNDLLDMQLFQLYRIFDKTLSAALFGQVSLDI